MFLPRKPAARGLPPGRVSRILAPSGKFAADVDVGQLRVDRVAGDHHALDELVRVLVDDVAVLERARLGLVRVADEVDRFQAVLLDETPLDAAWEPRAAASAQAAGLDLVDDVGLRHRQRLLQLFVAAITQVGVDVRPPARAVHVLEDHPLLARVRLFEQRNHGAVSQAKGLRFYCLLVFLEDCRRRFVDRRPRRSRR